MIISRTPYRVSLFGGGTDYPAWYKTHGGAVLGMAIDRYCYISVRYLPPFFAHKHRIVYSLIENVREVKEIQHPAVRAVLGDLGAPDGLEIHHDGDLPARAGLGSSSSFTVGLLNALYALRGRMVTKDFLAREAIRVEQDVICENVGDQDQIWAAYGGFNRITFHRDRSFEVAPIILPPERRDDLLSHFLLFFTGLSRNASEIAKDKIANFDSRVEHITAMGKMVDEAQAILCDPRRSISEIGALLHESWRLKRELAASVSTTMVDDIYQAARSAGAIGGKLLGAGGGGFMLLFASPAEKDKIREGLRGLIEVPIGIDSAGSRIVVYEPDGLGVA